MAVSPEVVEPYVTGKDDVGLVVTTDLKNAN
jgi:hypothetical protein